MICWFNYNDHDQNHHHDPSGCTNTQWVLLMLCISISSKQSSIIQTEASVVSKLSLGDVQTQPADFTAGSSLLLLLPYILAYISRFIHIYINVIGWIHTYNLKLSMVPNPPPKNPPDPPRPPELPWPPILLPCRYKLDLHHHRRKVQAFAITITIMIPALLVQALVIHLLGNPSVQFHFPASAWSLW